MKVVQTLLFFSLSLLLFSCDDEENREDFAFNAITLQQTQWIGTLDESYIASLDEPVSSTIETGIFFISKGEGKYSLKWENIDQPIEDIFEYTIDGKILTIKNGTKLNGNWLLLQFDKHKMVLEKGTGGDKAYKGVLTLTKRH